MFELPAAAVGVCFSHRALIVLTCERIAWHVAVAVAKSGGGILAEPGLILLQP